MKKIIILFFILVILIIGILIYLFNGFQINKTPYNFLYSKPWNALPKDKLMSVDDFYSKFIKKETGFCISTGKSPEDYILFKKQTDSNDCGGKMGCDPFIMRDASVCGNEYIIQNPKESGPMIYGIFELK